MKTFIFCSIFLSIACVGFASQEDPFSKLAGDLSSSIPIKKKFVRLGVGNFLYQGTEMMSPFSAKLREEMEMKLAKKDRIEVVIRDRISDLENEIEFQKYYDIADPGSKIEKLAIKGVDGIVRGQFYVEDSNVVVYSEVAWLDGGRIDKAKTVCPLKDFAHIVYPDHLKNEEHLKEAYFVPQNAEKSQKGIKEIGQAKILDIKHEIALKLRTSDGERLYKEGDIISFRVKSDQACHIAVICHQINGTSVVLFPNLWHRDTLIPADKTIEIPGAEKSGFEIEIGEPFGSDIVQVIACTDESALHREIKNMVSKTTRENPLVEAGTRGMFVKKINEAVQKSKSEKARWGESHIIVSTFSKEKK